MMGVKGMIMWAVFIAVCAAIIFISRNMKKQIEENGIETTGIISNPADDLKVGQSVRLKYHPKYKMNARLIGL